LRTSFVSLLTSFWTSLAAFEFADALAEATCKGRNLLGAEKDQNQQDNQENFRCPQTAEKANDGSIHENESCRVKIVGFSGKTMGTRCKKDNAGQIFKLFLTEVHFSQIYTLVPKITIIWRGNESGRRLGPFGPPRLVFLVLWIVNQRLR
jgi:hypothetical protein